MASICKTVSWQVEQLVGGIDQGSSRLPDLQRPFVWPTTKVRDLFDSMYGGYPVGKLMFWDDPSDEASPAIGEGSGLGGRHQIIDGQQQITSLYAAIKGKPVRNADYLEKQITISFNPGFRRARNITSSMNVISRTGPPIPSSLIARPPTTGQNFRRPGISEAMSSSNRCTGVHCRRIGISWIATSSWLGVAS